MHKLLRISIVCGLAVLFTGSALAETPPPAPVTGTVVLLTLLLCGLMGLLGQGCRVIVGFATIAASKAVAPADNQDVFNLARLLFSLVVGFLAGLVTALVQWKGGAITDIDVSNFDQMFKYAIAGYIGTDVIEAFTVQYFEKAKQDTPPPAPVADPPPPAQPRPVSDSISGTLMDVHTMVAAVADRVGDAVSPMSNFKAKAPAIMASLIQDFTLQDFQAAGILGNLGVECNGFTQLQEIHPVGGGVGGYGWAQWTGPRRRQYFAWCADHQVQRDSDVANYGFMKFEFDKDYRRVIDALRKTSTIEDATTLVLKEYEGAGVPATARRISWSKIALAAYQSEQA